MRALRKAGGKAGSTLRPISLQTGVHGGRARCHLLCAPKLFAALQNPRSLNQPTMPGLASWTFAVSTQSLSQDLTVFPL